ncbi:MAG: PAS domain S-box protein, partial [Methylococcaceae bacterium]
SPLRNGEHGQIGVAIDITSKRQVELQLRLNEERLRLSQEYADIGVWDCQVDSGQLRISEHLRESIGRKAVADCSLSSFLEAVHPEDRPRVAQALNASLRDGSPYDIEHRFLCDDGRIRWLNEKGKPVQPAAGAPVQLLGIIQDISTRKQAEHLLQVLHRVTSRIAEGAGEACAWNDILDGLLDLTDSEFGLIACRNDAPDAGACLEVFAVGERHWDAARRHDYRLELERCTDACSADCVLCEALTAAQPLLNNQLHGCTRLAGLAEGHPPLQNCLAMPLFYGSSLLGLYFLVNRAGGYHAKLVEFLAPFNSACASVIYAQKVSRERWQTLRELYAAKEEAEKANRAKSDFLSRMSHELRTPLNSVLGFAQLLQYEDDPALSGEQQEYVGQIVKSGSHLLQLINEVLDLAAIEVGKLQVTMDNLALSGPLSDCLAITAPLAQRKGIALIDQTGDGGVSWVRGDALRLKQVLLNLLSNAIKYNRPQGEVRVYTSRPSPGRLRLHIADTGPGIAPEQLATLFQPFNRLGLEYGSIEGSGIGLVITKSLVELMGGAMGVVSQPGQGSTFWFELDLLPAPEPEAATLLDGAAFDRQAARFSLSGTVLYLEDSPDNQKLMQEICKGYGDIR